MNRNDFYKELMSRYALDEEKIRVNAIKQAKKPAWQRFASNYWKPAVGTAAAVAVTVAAVAYTRSVPTAPEPQSPAPSALSASQRMSEAEQNYFNLQAADPFSDIYMTFSEPISYNNIIMSFSTIADPGEIRIEALYTENETFAGTENVRAFSSSRASEKTVIAAKVSALSVYYRDLQDLPTVFLAELGSEALNDETFSPLAVEDADPLVNDSQSAESAFTVTAANVTTTAFSFDSSSLSSSEPPVLGASGDDSSVTTLPPDTGESGASSDTQTEPGETEPDETEPDETEPEQSDVPGEAPETDGSEASEAETSAPETTEPEETTTTEAAVPANEITAVQADDPDNSLLTEIYELNVENSLEVCLIGNNAIVLTKNAVYMYTLGSTEAPQSRMAEINSPKIAHKDNSTVIITGCDSRDVRNIVSVIDLNADSIHTYDVSGNIGSASIGAVHYCKAGNKYFIKSVHDGKSFVYEAEVSGFTGIQFRPLVESDGPVSIAGCKNELLYLAKSGTGTENTCLYSFNCVNGDIQQIASFESVMRIKRGCDLESFALISDSEKYIYDVNIGMLIANSSIDDNTLFVTEGGKTFFKTGSTVYEIGANSQIEQTYRGIAFEQELSSDFVISESSSEKIIIVRGNKGSGWLS